MSVGRYLEGVVLLVLCAGALVVGARRLRRRLVPAAEGIVARIADGVTWFALLVLTLEAVGVIGILDRVGVIAGCLVTGAVTWGIGARAASVAAPVHAPARAETVPTSPHRKLAVTVMIVSVSVVAAAWTGWTIFAYRNGMETIDSLWYHLPLAARFVQLHNIRHLQYFDDGAITVFYPDNSELLHAFGMVLFGNDVLSPVIDLLWGAAALAGAWAIGRPWGREPHCVLACVPVLATPGLVDTQPGGAYDDIVGLALLLASIALIVNAPGGATAGSGRRLPLGTAALAAAAAGLALGTKFTMIAPAIVLALGAVVVLGRGRRLRDGAVWVGGLVICGGYWYLRNAIVVGNPLPSLSLHLGPISLPSPHITPVYTVWQFLFERHIWTNIFIPGLRQSFGLAWWALILGSIAGALAATLRGRRDPRLALLGVLTLASGIAFLLTKQTLGLPGAPIFFVDNVRYADITLALGLLLLALAPILGRPAATLVWLLAGALALLFTVLDPGVWNSGFPVKPFAAPVHGIPALGGVAAGAVLLIAGEAWLWRDRLLRRPGRRRLRESHGAGVAVALGVAGAVAIGGWFVAGSYQHDRYRHTSPMPAIYAWAQHVSGARIGIVGANLQYPLTGSNDSNHVQYIGVGQPHHGFASAVTCEQWRRSVNRGRYEYVVVSPVGFGGLRGAPTLGWTRTSPDAHPILRQFLGKVEYAVLFRIIGPLDPATCPHA
jgi:hypothetical protein